MMLFGKTGMAQTVIELNRGNLDTHVTEQQKPSARYEIKSRALNLVVRGTRFRAHVSNIDHISRSEVLAAIQVSNHGGRALDGTPAVITVLPSIAEVVKGDVPLILDSGIRRGTDVVKALALGANAVPIGRPVMFGLTLGGASGVDSVINYLRRETVNTVLHLGANRIGALGRQHLRQSAAPGTQVPVQAGADRLA
ncbi:protein of unknown function [Candidatus Nitrotoga arctica]|uniref:FMN hydroxy acid dehydrogenase domain-containing protein n=2 Tax=Candidatus Nitrotoga arctica TaxID=453162 RepID=A0ABN8ASC6_9PROT|nr:protein of unknown function [Candidatus Nitrotoga arctica]